MPRNAILRWIYIGLGWIYSIGYSVYLFMAGWAAWPNMTFWSWLVHVSWESVYALAWPVLMFMR